MLPGAGANDHTTIGFAFLVSHRVANPWSISRQCCYDELGVPCVLNNCGRCARRMPRQTTSMWGACMACSVFPCLRGCSICLLHVGLAECLRGDSHISSTYNSPCCRCLTDGAGRNNLTTLLTQAHLRSRLVESVQANVLPLEVLEVLNSALHSASDDKCLHVDQVAPKEVLHARNSLTGEILYIPLSSCPATCSGLCFQSDAHAHAEASHRQLQ